MERVCLPVRTSGKLLYVLVMQVSAQLVDLSIDLGTKIVTLPLLLALDGEITSVSYMCV